MQNPQAAATSVDGTVDSDRLATVLDQTRSAARVLSLTSAVQRNQVLQAMGEAILSHRDQILEANTLDLEISREMAVPETVTDWLKLTPERIDRAAQIFHRLGELGDLPSLGGANAVAVRPRPVGVVALVYESFPDLAAIAAGLCLRTGNGLILKGGSESSQTNQTLVTVLHDAIATTDLPPDSLQLIPQDWNEVTRAVLVQQPALDLVIPYGRPKLVRQVVEQATVPVLPTYIGNCCLCVCPSAAMDTVVQVILDSHRGDPDAVNRIETVILAGEFEPVWLSQLWQRLASVLMLKGTPSLVRLFNELTVADEDEWACPSFSTTVAFRLTATLSAALDWMNQQGDHRAASLCTNLQTDVQQFVATARGTVLYINSSPRFYRNPSAAADIALGMSAQIGPVGLSALTYPQQVVYPH